MQSKIKITNNLDTVGVKQSDVTECIETLLVTRRKLINKEVVSADELQTLLHEAADLLLMRV
ncbi:hypothetical protein EGX54_24055 [Vibrio parahaemolyticus]|nr:hypothetical protein [Vibrio parahaemolyticus]OOI04739.1 hypothetical protein BIW16_07720 [Vibrio sp. OULL4]